MPLFRIETPFARKPLLVTAMLVAAILVAWRLGITVPRFVQGSVLRSAVLIDLLVIVPAMLVLAHKAWRNSNELSASEE